MMNIDIIIIMAMHTSMKIHFSLNTINKGTITSRTWHNITPSPLKIVSSLFVYVKISYD